MSEQSTEKIEKLAAILQKSSHIVAFTGAGVSTESDIPDFRSAKGVYESVEREYGRPAEVLLSHSFFASHPDIFFDYMRKYLIFKDAKPNFAHKGMAALEREGKLTAVVTQNIDGLHTKSGSKNVYELHGSVERNYCIKCGKIYGLDYVLGVTGIPRCDKCGGIIRPDIVLYEEALNSDVTNRAVSEIRRADTLLIMGTSLVVYPAAGFVNYFRGSNIIIINKDATQYDEGAQLLIRAKAGETVKAALDILGIKL